MAKRFLLIYFIFHGHFLFVEVNGNEEDIAIFFTDALQCVQRIVRETDSLGNDSVILDRLISELDGYARTISLLLLINQQHEGDIRGALVTLEALILKTYVFNMS